MQRCSTIQCQRSKTLPPKYTCMHILMLSSPLPLPTQQVKSVAAETIHGALLILFSALQVYVEGRVLHRTLPSCRYQFITEASYAAGNSEEVTMCNVEQIVLDHYRTNGFPKGQHAKATNSFCELTHSQACVCLHLIHFTSSRFLVKCSKVLIPKVISST